MLPTRAWPVVLVAALVAVAGARPAPAPAPPARTGPPSDPTDAPDTIDNTTRSAEEEVRYPEGSTGPERPGWGTGSGRIFSQLVAPLVQLVVNQLLQATNLVAALAGAGGAAGQARPNAVLEFFSAALGASSGGNPFPARARAPFTL